MLVLVRAQGKWCPPVGAVNARPSHVGLLAGFKSLSKDLLGTSSVMNTWEKQSPAHSLSHKNKPWTWDTPVPKKSPHTLCQAYQPVKVPFPVSDWMCAPLFCLSMDVNDLGAHNAMALEGCSLAIGWGWGTPWATLHTAVTDLAVSKWKKTLPSSAWPCCFPWQLWYQEVMDRSVWTYIPGGWHCDDPCYPPCNCSPLLALVPGTWCSRQTCLAWGGLAGLGPLPSPHLLPCPSTPVLPADPPHLHLPSREQPCSTFPSRGSSVAYLS